MLIAEQVPRRHLQCIADGLIDPSVWLYCADLIAKGLAIQIRKRLEHRSPVGIAKVRAYADPDARCW